jgi:hypothetical protein
MRHAGARSGGGWWFTYRQHLYRIQHTLKCDLKHHWILQLRAQSDCVAAGDARVLCALRCGQCCATIVVVFVGAQSDVEVSDGSEQASTPEREFPVCCEAATTYRCAIPLTKLL